VLQRRGPATDRAFFISFKERWRLVNGDRSDIDCLVLRFFGLMPDKFALMMGVIWQKRIGLQNMFTRTQMDSS
jgi:hypothetical protein